MFYCKSENLHILLQSFRGFVKRIVLLLHAIKYSLTVIKVWIMQILLPLSTGNTLVDFYHIYLPAFLSSALLIWWFNLRVTLICHVVFVDWWFLNWQRLIGRNIKILHMIIWNSIFWQFTLSSNIFINFDVTCPVFMCFDTGTDWLCSSRSTLYFSAIIMKNASYLPRLLFFLLSSAFL